MNFSTRAALRRVKVKSSNYGKNPYIVAKIRKLAVTVAGVDEANIGVLAICTLLLHLPHLIWSHDAVAVHIVVLHP